MSPDSWSNGDLVAVGEDFDDLVVVGISDVDIVGCVDADRIGEVEVSVDDGPIGTVTIESRDRASIELCDVELPRGIDCDVGRPVRNTGDLAVRGIDDVRDQRACASGEVPHHSRRNITDQRRRRGNRCRSGECRRNGRRERTTDLP